MPWYRNVSEKSLSVKTPDGKNAVMVAPRALVESKPDFVRKYGARLVNAEPPQEPQAALEPVVQPVLEPRGMALVVSEKASGSETILEETPVKTVDASKAVAAKKTRTP